MSREIKLSKESEYYRKLEVENGTHLALYIMCGVTDTLLDPMILPPTFGEYVGDKWKKYLELLNESGKNGGFFDGVTNIRRIFGREMSQQDFAKYVAQEQDRIEKLPGTETQREKWGVGELCKGLSLTSEIYEELDHQFKLWSERYKGQTLTPQLENSIITICKRNMVADFLIKAGNFSDAAKMQKMVDDLMASEQMRKKDEKPIETLKMDALVVALEKDGLMEDGQLLTFDELIPVMRDTYIKSPKYNYSLDVCDQMILDYYNNQRANSDMEMVSVLPQDLKVEDEYGEFAAGPSDDQQKRMKYAGLTPVQFEKEGE